MPSLTALRALARVCAGGGRQTWGGAAVVDCASESGEELGVASLSPRAGVNCDALQRPYCAGRATGVKMLASDGTLLRVSRGWACSFGEGFAMILGTWGPGGAEGVVEAELELEFATER